MKCRHAFVSRWVRRYQQSGHVNDQLKLGRPPKANAAAVQHILMVAQLPDCNTADAIAAKTEQVLKLCLSRSTVKRLAQGTWPASPATQGHPTADSQAEVARVKFAKAALRRELASWRRVMITDSKYFYLHNMGRHAASWCTPATRGTSARPKTSISAHVYMGMSNWGTNTLKFVTLLTSKSASMSTPNKGLAQRSRTG